MKSINLFKLLLFTFALMLLSGCVSSYQHTIEDLKPISYDAGHQENLPYDFDDVIPLVRDAMESEEAKLVVQEEQELEDGSRVFFSRTTFMKMDFDPGAVVRVLVKPGSNARLHNTTLLVYSMDLTKSGMPALKKADDYAEIIVMKVDAALKSSAMEKRYQSLE